MARINEDVLSFSFRMYLNNPQHMRIAKALREIDEERYKSKNQFVADAITFYLDNYDEESVQYEQGYVTHKEMAKMQRGLREEMLELIRVELMRPYNVIALASAMQTPQQTPQLNKEEPDDTIADLVSDWD